MISKPEVIEFCLTLNDAYEDYPFRDNNWTIMRHKSNNKMFAAIYEHLGRIWINVKCEPEMVFVWRDLFDSVVPAYHMNKVHWNSIILDGTVPVEEIKAMIGDSFMLTGPRRKRKKHD